MRKASYANPVEEEASRQETTKPIAVFFVEANPDLFQCRCLDELLGWEVVGSLRPALAAERLAGESTY